MSLVAGDPLELTYWHFKEQNSIMNWHEITAQSKDFTKAFESQLGQNRTEDKDTKQYFHARIPKIVELKEQFGLFLPFQTDQLFCIRPTRKSSLLFLLELQFF